MQMTIDLPIHRFIHVGEIQTVRSRLDHNIDKMFGPDWGRALA